MTSRMFAASIVLLGIGSMIAPVETSARSGGLIAAPSLSARGAVRPSVAAPPAARTSLPQGMTGGFRAHTGEFRAHIRDFRTRDFRMARFGDRRRFGFPPWWGYAPYFTSYYPSDYGAPYDDPPYAYPPAASPPTENSSERPRPVVVYQSGCRTDTEKVPSATGGEATVSVTRCH
jgi:hypothetical protein